MAWSLVGQVCGERHSREGKKIEPAILEVSMLYLQTKNYSDIVCRRFRLCPAVRVHKGITIVRSLFRSHWLAVVYCLVLCSGSFEPVHEDRTPFSV